MGGWVGGGRMDGWFGGLVSHSASPGKQSQVCTLRTGKCRHGSEGPGHQGLLDNCPMLRIWGKLLDSLPSLPWIWAGARVSVLTSSPTGRSPRPTSNEDRTGFPGFSPKPLAKLLWDVLDNTAKPLRSTRCAVQKAELCAT